MNSRFLLCSSVLLFMAGPIVVHAASCTGTAPTNATLCVNDNQNITVNTPLTLTDQCTDAKCEYTCNDGFVKYNNVCVGCTGTTPSNAQMCTADDQGLTKNVTKTVVSSCTENTKCQFTCNAGLAKDGTKNSCVPACKGTPSNAIMCADDDQGVATALTSTVSTKGCTNTKCEFICNEGFAKDPKTQNCVRPCIAEPTNAIVCTDDDKNMATAVNSTVLTTACKQNNTKCEFTCKPGFAKVSTKINDCISACKGTPINATMCNNDDQDVPLALTSIVSTKGCTNTKCEFICNEGFAKDPKTQNCIYPCLNAQSSAKAIMCAGDDQGIGATAIASTIKKFGSQCTDKTKCEFICKEDYVPEGGKCIPKQCSGNTKPALQISDPECWTSQTTSHTVTCTWAYDHMDYECGPYHHSSKSDCSDDAYCVEKGECWEHGKVYKSTCGKEHCSNDGPVPDTYTETYDVTTYSCHYITVNTWGDCNVDTGVQLATSVTQNIAKNTKDCTNLSQATVRYCGICGDGIQEADEVCDDGNQIDGDGCNSICRLEIGELTDGPTEPPFDPRDHMDDPGDESGDGNGSGADDHNGVNGRMIETRP